MYRRFTIESVGSPPRVRGTAGTPGQGRAGQGITPACAGNRAGDADPVGVAKDHPRVCGEQSGRCGGGKKMKGSPPRVRGTAIRPGEHQRPKRITPACAGNRSRSSWIPPISRDHPRVCGEQWMRLNRNTRTVGSPPRVRGTGHLIAFAVVRGGITPACAGNRAQDLSSALFKKDHPRVCGEQLFFHCCICSP